MPVKPSLVVNSSPLIALVAALRDFDSISEIAERFIVPFEVISELEAGGLKDDTALRVRSAPWCEVRSRPACAGHPLIDRLGAGEAAVIQIGVDEGFLPAVIDEVSGRRAARLAGLRVIGSLGILVELHHAGCLPSLADSIRAMQSKGIYLAQQLIDMALDAARPRRE
jgi:predicted nucleic acid-binding protein